MTFDIDNFIGQTEYAWVVPVSFAGILVLNLFTGIFKGWKSGLYYALWNIGALVTGVFATKPIIKLVFDNIDTSSVPINLEGFLSDHPAIVPLALIAWLVIFVIFAYLIKLFFRKKLAPAKPFTWKARLGSMAISVVSSVPLAVLVANATTVVTGSNDFSPFVDTMVQGITFGQDEGVSKYVDEIANVINLIKNGGAKSLEDMFAGQAPTGLTPENHNTIQNVLNGPSVPSILQNAQGSLLQNLLTPPTSFPVIQDKFEISQASWDQITSVLKYKYFWSNAKMDELKASFLNVK